MVLFNINGFFDDLEKVMDKAIEQEFITHDCKELYAVYSDIDEMLDYIENYDQNDIDISKVKIR